MACGKCRILEIASSKGGRDVWTFRIVSELSFCLGRCGSGGGHFAGVLAFGGQRVLLVSLFLQWHWVGSSVTNRSDFLVHCGLKE